MRTDFSIDSFPDELEIIGFRVGQREFGLDISHVQRVIPMVEITEVPQPLPFLEGVIDLMGLVVPVISLRRLLGFPHQPYTLRNHIIIGDKDNKTVGIVVDAVSDLMQIPKTAIDSPRNIMPLREFLSGVARLESKILFLLRLDTILDFEQEAENRAGLGDLMSADSFLQASGEEPEAESGDEEELDPARQILHQRAVNLSRRVEHDETPTRQLLTFSLSDEWYGVHTASVKTIVASPEIVPVPCAPNYVCGVMNLRGEILTVVDLKRFFGLASRQKASESTVVVVIYEGTLVGLVVDSVHDVAELPTTSVERPLSTIERIRADYIEGEARIGDRLVGILKLETTLNPEHSAEAI